MQVTFKIVRLHHPQCNQWSSTLSSLSSTHALFVKMLSNPVKLNNCIFSLFLELCGEQEGNVGSILSKQPNHSFSGYIMLQNLGFKIRK